jgi:hypothetical protein
MSYSRLSPVQANSVLLVSTNRCRHVRKRVDGKQTLLSYYWNDRHTMRVTVVPQQGGGWIVELHKQEGNICHFSKFIDDGATVRSLVWGVINSDDLAAVVAGAFRIYSDNK